MNTTELLSLLEQLTRGDLDVASAHGRLVDALRARPFEDLGFARVDHHRAIRQGFPEVILGLGKTPAQIGAIAAEIAGRGSTLLVTRASEAGLRAPCATEVPERRVLPRCRDHRAADSRTSRAGKGTILVCAAGTSDLVGRRGGRADG